MKDLSICLQKGKYSWGQHQDWQSARYRLRRKRWKGPGWKRRRRREFSARRSYPHAMCSAPQLPGHRGRYHDEERSNLWAFLWSLKWRAHRLWLCLTHLAAHLLKGLDDPQKCKPGHCCAQPTRCGGLSSFDVEWAVAADLQGPRHAWCQLSPSWLVPG